MDKTHKLGRIQLKLPAELHKQAKMCAVNRMITLTAWLVEAAREKIERENR